MSNDSNCDEEKSYLKSGIKEQVDECTDIDLLYLISSLLSRGR